MTEQAMAKVAAKTAAEICAAVELSDGARAQLIKGGTPDQFLERLIEAGLMQDAMRFLAHALPKREAVWWACTAIRSASPSPRDLACVEAAEAWVRKPAEDERRAAWAAAQAVESRSAAAWAAIAAFWSGGSLAPAEAPPVPPADTLTAVAVSGALMLAAAEREPDKIPDKHRRFVELGQDIARGGTGRK